MKQHPAASAALIAISIVACLVLAAQGAHAALQPNVVVTSFNIRDGDASVGKSFTLAVTLQNTEPAACAQSITTTLQAGPPYIMNGVSSVSAGDLCFGDKKVVEFPLKVDPTGTGGFYQVTIANTFETSLLAQYASSSTLNLFVEGTPQLAAHIVDSTPLDVYPGDTATVTVALQNDGGFEAQSVVATLVAPSPLEVKWSHAVAPLGTIDAKQQKTTDFAIEVPKDAPAKEYPTTLRVTYLDENLAPQSAEFPLVFHVKEKAQFETKGAGSDALYANENDRVVRLTVTNTGTDTARKMKIKIQPQFPFSTDGSVRYIDTLAPKASAPLEFVMNVDKDATVGSYGLDAIVDFEDAQGKKLQDTAKVALTVERKSILRAVFVDYWFGWLVVVLVFAMVARKKAAKKK